MPELLTQRQILLAAIALLLSIVFGWWMWLDAPTSTRPGAARNRDVPVIIYLVDTLRADHLSAYGGDFDSLRATFDPTNLTIQVRRPPLAKKPCAA